MIFRKTQGGRRGSMHVLSVAVLTILLAGCDSLLDVELPTSVDQSELNSPSFSALLVRSTIAQLECAYSRFVSGNAAGNEDVFQGGGDQMSGAAEYEVEVGFANFCSSGGDSGYDWFDPFQSTRFLGEDTYAKLTGWSDAEVATGLEGQIQNRQEALAITAVYTAIPFEIFGTYLCEVSFDGGTVVTARESLDSAEAWVTRAIDLIDAMPDGDFAMPDDYSIFEGAPATGGMRAFAYGLRARIRWAMNDAAKEAEALMDADEVPMGFFANITRGTENDVRENDVWRAHYEEAYLPMVEDPIDWWDPAGGRTNPVTGLDWPDPLPFTGYVDLAIEDATGRAIDANRNAVFGGTGNTDDGRVAIESVCVGGFGSGCFFGTFENSAAKYTAAEQSIPLLNWQDIWLIRAELQGGMNAIDLVNELRDDAGLPEVQGTYLTDLTDGTNDADEILDMIIEERRRALFLEGRFWATKIQNTDRLWFPRAQGQNDNGIDLGGAVRMLMQEFEFDVNPNLDVADRNNNCDVNERAVVT